MVAAAAAICRKMTHPHRLRELRFIGIVAIALALLTLAPRPALAAGEVVGKVIGLQGAAVALQDAMPRTLAVGSDILQGDVVSTGIGGRVKLRMIDDTEFSLGERSLFIVEEFLMSTQQSSALTNLVTGAVAVVTGQIAKLQGNPFQLRTPVATLGVRGTTFWGGQLDGNFQFALLDGPALIVENAAGTVEITTVGQGTLVSGPNAAPDTPTEWGQAKIARAAAITAVP